VFIWMYIVYEALVAKRPALSNQWVHQELFTNVKDATVVNTLEWLHQSPPVFHTYSELPYLVHSTK
jgi:hypothetical protein